MMTDQSQNLKACILVALSATLYGFLGYLGTKALEGNLSTSTMLFWRFFISVLWMIIFIVRNRSLQKFLDVNKSVLLFTLLTGAAGYAGSSGFFFIASEDTGTGVAMVIFFAYPIMVALFSWITQKNFNLKTFLALLAMMLGLFFIKGESDNDIGLTSILFAIAAAISYAFYIIGSKKYASNLMDSNILTVLVSVGCASLFLGFALVTNSFSFPNDLKTIAYLIALGIFATALPIQLMLEGLKIISSVRASIISVLEPLVTVLVGVLFLNESISSIQILGVIIIISSALLIQFQKNC